MHVCYSMHAVPSLGRRQHSSRYDNKLSRRREYHRPSINRVSTPRLRGLLAIAEKCAAMGEGEILGSTASLVALLVSGLPSSVYS